VSLYSVGIVGSELLGRRRLAVDYPNRRIGILRA
jgi:hypothetical protein